jgi:uncharacterized protein (TIGR02444 family)
LTLWDWALEAYARPDVAPACLSLQDDHGQNVSFLLWAVWASPDHAAILTGVGLAREWDTTVLRPLRQVRRRLPAGELRDEVRAVELRAEQALLAALETLTPRGEGDGLQSLAAATAAWGAAAPKEALQRLAGAVSGI